MIIEYGGGKDYGGTFELHNLGSGKIIGGVAEDRYGYYFYIYEETVPNHAETHLYTKGGFAYEESAGEALAACLQAIKEARR